MSSFLGNYLADPDGAYMDSTPKKQPRHYNDNFSSYSDGEYDTLDNSSSVNIDEYKGGGSEKTFRYPTAFGQKSLKKLPDKVYPKNGGAKTQKASGNPNQEFLIAKELGFKEKKRVKKIKFKKYYTRLEWYLTGTTPLGKGVVHLDVGKIIQHFGADRAVIRDIVPVWGHSSMVGHTAKIVCTGYPGLNRMSCASNIVTEKKEKYFVSICPGIKEVFEGIEKKDVLQIGKKGTITTLIDYKDDTSGQYPFRTVMEDYEKLLKRTAFLKEMKKCYKTYPKSGLDYLKELIQASKPISLVDVEEMDTREWEKTKFRSKPGDDTILEQIIVNPEKSKYVQFASYCPFFEGAKELRYFHPLEKEVRYISLPRHKQLLKLLRLLKRKQGIISTIPFKLVGVGNGFGTRTHYGMLPGVVTLKVCVKVSIIK